MTGAAPDEVCADIFAACYKESLTPYSPENIFECCRLLVRRSLEFSRLG